MYKCKTASFYCTSMSLQIYKVFITNTLYLTVPRIRFIFQNLQIVCFVDCTGLVFLCPRQLNVFCYNHVKFNSCVLLFFVEDERNSFPSSKNVILYDKIYGQDILRTVIVSLWAGPYDIKV